MKRKIILTTIGLALLAIGFASGRFVQHSKSGYHYEVRDRKEYGSPIGPIRWSYVAESIGTPFLDSGTTILEVDGRTIYKAKRAFQEVSPYAKNINVDQDRISWDDGDYRFDLSMHKIKNGEQGGGGNPAKPGASP